MSSPATPALARTHYENFPVASWLCPPHLRAPISAIYGFARTADDLADEGEASAAERLQDLADYRNELHALYEGKPTSARWCSVWEPLRTAVTSHHLPLHLLDALLLAFRQDVRYTDERRHYESHAQLCDYASRSANPVGRLLLHLHGIDDAAALAQSDAICTALQLINFWQDLSVDLPRARYYLPADALQQYGITMTEIIQDTRPEITRAIIMGQCLIAQTLMHEGRDLPLRMGGRLGWELRLVMQGGLRILEKIHRIDYRTRHIRPKIRAWDAPLLLARAAFHALPAPCP